MQDEPTGAQDAVDRLLDAHLEDVWAQVDRLVPDRVGVLDVVVGTFRAAGADGARAVGEPGPWLAATATTLAGRPRRSPAITALGAADLGRTVPAITDLAGPTTSPPSPAELRDVRDRVRADHDPWAPTLPRRRRGARALAALGVVALVGVAVAVVREPATPGVEPSSEPTAIVVAARAAAAAEGRAGAAISAASGVPETGVLLLDQHLARCADAVRVRGGQSRYPPPSTWRMSRAEVSAGGVTSSISHTFFCATTPTEVWVSGTLGVTAGAVQVVRVGPRQVGVLNPGGATVSLGPLDPDAPGADTTGTDPSQLVLLGSTLRGVDVAPWGLSLRVGPAGGGAGSTFEGPLPDPGRTAIRVADTGAVAQERTSAAGALLGRCLASNFGSTAAEPDVWAAATARTLEDGTELLAARAPGMAGLCAEQGDQQVFLGVSVESPGADGALRVVSGVGAVAGAPRSYLVLSVDPRAVSLQVSGTREPVTCLVADGVGVCSRVSSATDPGLVTALDADGAVVAGPVVLS